MSENLWPSFGDIPQVNTPKKILAEQAAFLEKNTGNFLRAEVRTNNVPARSNGGERIAHSLVVIAPFLGNYSFTLLRVAHEVARIYPVEVQHTIISNTYNPEDESELKEVLREIFAHNTTVDVLNNLLIQSKPAV